VLHPDVIEFTLRYFEEELHRAADRPGDEAACIAGRRPRSRKKIGNLTRALADGYSPAITADLPQLEEQLAEIRRRTAASRPDAVQVRMRDTRRFVESRLSNLQSVFASEPVTIRAEIANTCKRSR